MSKTQEDESYVRRCYHSGFFDPAPFIEDDFDVFVVQNLELMSMPELLEIYSRIKEKAKTVLVIREGGPPRDSDFSKFKWDAIVCFDARYQRFLSLLFRASE